MKASRLDRRVEIQEPVETPSESGDPLVIWRRFARVWAEKIELTGRTMGRESLATLQTVAQIDAIWQIRYRPGLTAKMRLVYQDKIYDIVAFQEIGRRDGLELQTVETE